MTKNVKVLLVGLAVSIVILFMSIIFSRNRELENDLMTTPGQTVEVLNEEREDSMEELLVD